MKKNSVSKYATWLLPGLQVKRWFILTFLGTIFLILGILFVFNLDPVYGVVAFLKAVVSYLNPQIVGLFLLAMGVVALYLGSKKMNVSILDAISPQDRDYILENLYKRRKLNKGPKIVVIGGGTGLSTILKGLKTITNNLYRAESLQKTLGFHFLAHFLAKISNNKNCSTRLKRNNIMNKRYTYDGYL